MTYVLIEKRQPLLKVITSEANWDLHGFFEVGKWDL